jgi:hypothetical protein
MRQSGATGDRNLPRRIAGGDRVDQIGVKEQRRALQQRRRRRHVGLIARQRVNDGRRRLVTRSKCRGQRLADQRRRIVEQHDHGAFGGGPIVVREVRIKVSASQCTGGFGALAGRSGTQPVKKLTDDHDHYRHARPRNKRRGVGVRAPTCWTLHADV